MAWHLLDTSSTSCYLSSFSSFVISQSQQLLDTWWIDRESTCLLNSFSTPSGSIELLFLDLMSCSSIPQLSTTFSSIPPSIAVSTPLDSCLDTSRYLHLSSFTEDLYIRSLRSGSHFFDLSLSALVHLPNTISLTPNLFLYDFLRFLLLVSF